MARLMFNEEAANKILLAIQAGCTVRASCGSYGINEDTFHKWRTKYPDFGKRVLIARSKCELKMSVVITTSANTDPKYALEWLKRNSPEWRDKLDLNKMDVDTLESLFARMDVDE